MELVGPGLDVGVLVRERVGVGVGVGVDVGVLVGVVVGVLVGVVVGVLVGVVVGVLVGVVVGVLVGVDVGLGDPEEEPVVYELPSGDSVTMVDWTYSELPVPPSPLQQATAHSTVPPSVTPVMLSSCCTVPSSVEPAPNGAVRPLLITVEMRLRSVPSGLNSSTRADPWKPFGQPSVVDQVGVRVVAPLAGLRIRLPGSEPFAASASPAVTSPAPVVIPTSPKNMTARRTLLAVRHLLLASRTPT
jgi:hypothetical protein